jgi:hypothetical protein
MAANPTLQALCGTAIICFMELASFTVEFFEHVLPGELKSTLTLFSVLGGTSFVPATAVVANTCYSALARLPQPKPCESPLHTPRAFMTPRAAPMMRRRVSLQTSLHSLSRQAAWP